MAPTVSGYAARRLLTTVADIVRAPPQNRIVLGHWSGNQQLQGTAAAMAMPSRCGDSRFHSEARVRQFMIEFVRCFCKNMSRQKALSLEWEDLLRSACLLRDGRRSGGPDL